MSNDQRVSDMGVVQRLRECDLYEISGDKLNSPLRGCDTCEREAVAIVGFKGHQESDQRVCEYHAEELLEVADDC